MAIKADREYRNLGNFEIKADETKKRAVGYASTFEPYKLATIDGVDYFERIAPTAFENADMTDVVFLRDHTGPVLARTKNGTVTLSVNENGLWTETDLSKTEAARAMQEDIEVGNYSQMSFSFVVEADHFDRETRPRVIDSFKKIYDVSAVAFPANPGAEIGISARDYFNGVIEMEKAERLEREIRERQAKKIKLMLEVTKNDNAGN